MYAAARLCVGSLLTALTVGLTHADEPAKTEFKTASMEALTKDGKRHDWTDAKFIENLKGSDGLELLLTSEYGAVFRKSKDGPKWEYKAVKAKNSPFSSGMRDTEAFALILDRMGLDGYWSRTVSRTAR